MWSFKSIVFSYLSASQAKWIAIKQADILSKESWQNYFMIYWDSHSRTQISPQQICKAMILLLGKEPIYQP